MIFNLFIFLIGICLIVIGNIYIISYLNLLTLGYNFFEYVKFIIGRLECMISVVGIVIVFFIICISKKRKRRKNELHI